MSRERDKESEGAGVRMPRRTPLKRRTRQRTLEISRHQQRATHRVATWFAGTLERHGVRPADACAAHILAACLLISTFIRLQHFTKLEYRDGGRMGWDGGRMGLRRGKSGLCSRMLKSTAQPQRQGRSDRGAFGRGRRTLHAAIAVPLTVAT